MSLLYIMSFMDALAAVSIVLFSMNALPWNVPAFFVVYLFGKIIFFHKDVASILDAGVVAVLLLSFFGVSSQILLLLCVFYLIQKALRSLI